MPALTGAPIALSIVIPVYNEERNLPALFARLYPVLDAWRSADGAAAPKRGWAAVAAASNNTRPPEPGRRYEIVLTNDGSTDGSLARLREQHRARPDVTCVIDFDANYGQHMAVMAGFAHARGDVVVTLDADLQNPPEEIPKLLELIDAGHDYVGGFRIDRRDPWFRAVASRMINFLRERLTSLRMTDHGCMLRAYRREVVEAVVRSGATRTFIPALAYTFARRPAEVGVRHEPRHAGESKYSLWKLIRLNFDLMRACSGKQPQIVPAQPRYRVREVLGADAARRVASTDPR